MEIAEARSVPWNGGSRATDISPMLEGSDVEGS